MNTTQGHREIVPQGEETFTSRRIHHLIMDEKSQHLSSSGEDTVFFRYVLLLSDADSSRRWRAAEGLARLGDLRALDPLVQALQDPDWRVRIKAAWGLGILGDPRAAIPLRRAMANPAENDRVKEIIEEAIQKIAGRGSR